jgi:S1-C subfamily serine protease
MRAILLLIALLVPASAGATDWNKVYLQTLNEHVVMMSGDEGYCTAFAIAPDRFLTANHCLADPTSLLFDQFGLAYNFEVVRRNEDLDLAVLKAHIPTKTPIEFAEKAVTNEAVIAVGVRYLFQHVTPANIITTIVAFSPYWVAIQSAYYPGFSGGPLVDKDGKLVGLNDANDTKQLVGLAIKTPVILIFLHEEQ